MNYILVLDKDDLTENAITLGIWEGLLEAMNSNRDPRLHAHKDEPQSLEITVSSIKEG